MNPTANAARGPSFAVLLAAMALSCGCTRFSQSYYLSQRDSEIRKSAAAIASAKTDAQSAAAYANRGDAFADKSRYSRVMKLISGEEYKKMFDLAMQDYAQAIALDSGSAKMYYRRGTAYYFRASLDMIYDTKATTYLVPARADFSKAAQLDSKDAQTLDMLGLTDASLQDWTPAIADFEKEAAIEPKSQYRLSDAYCNRGDAYLAEGKYDMAAADLKRAIELGNKGGPCDCNPYNSLLTIYLTKTHAYEDAPDLAAKAKAAGRSVEPAYVEQLKALKAKR